VVLEQALARAGGVKTEAARLLSLTFRSLRYRLAKYGIGES
jgi:two-component system response regulator PilR (NtrC family)